MTDLSQTQEQMKVRVMYRNNWFGGDGWTYYPVDVVISANCPVCGQRRGTPTPRNFCEDGEWVVVDVWKNPCGHKDLYPDVLREAGYRR
jgi:hypothetical protein